MDPLTLALLGGGGLATLFGGGGNKQPSAADLDRLFGAGALASRTNTLYSLLANSPAFRAQLGNIGASSASLGNSINANLSRAGLLGTGVGATGAALADSAGGFARANAQGGLYTGALDKASQLNAMLAELFANTRKTGPSALQTLGSSVLGALGPNLLTPRAKAPKADGSRIIGGGNSAPVFGDYGDQGNTRPYNPILNA